jgi:hypothetical protein
VFQRDYILRMIEVAGQAIARALGLLVKKKPEEAEQALAEGYGALGIDRELLLFLDARTLRTQLGDDDRLALAVRLLACDSEIKWHKGEASAARRRLKAAQRLLAEHSAPSADLETDLQRLAQLTALQP